MTKVTVPHSYMRLKFEIDHPGLDECWAAGYEAGRADMTEEANPYPENCHLHQYWNEGWWSAFYAEDPLQVLGPDAAILCGTDAETLLDEQGHLPQAANDKIWHNPELKKWIIRVAKLTGLIAITVAAVELSDIAA